MRSIFVAALLVAVAVACGNRGPQTGTQAAPAAGRVELIKALSPAAGEKFRTGDQVIMVVLPADNLTPDSVAIYLDGRRRIVQDNEMLYNITSSSRVGRIPWHAVAYLDGDSSARYSEMVIYPKDPPRQWGYRVKNSYPHSEESYTQGLLWHDGFLYESTGLNGQSALLRVRLQDGKVMQRRDLDEKFFGEGLALVGEKLYQLTWQNNTAFIYDRGSFEPVGQFSYTGEGWGLTSDGKLLYMSDGTEKIRVIDPATLQTVRTLTACTDRIAVQYLNELEWIEGEIWANVYTSSNVVRIDPATGRVKGIIELGDILQDEDITAATDVMNGIAYDPAGKRIFVTGKNWNKLFEIELVAK